MRNYYYLLISVTLIIIDQNYVWTFNVETDHYAIYRGGAQSMFGFSVAEYRDESHRGWVIAGAPLNETNQVGIEKGGAVFRCDIAEDDRCFPIEFDSKGVDYVRSTKNPKGKEPIDEKSYQWFGATISTSMIDGGPLLACAPKYHWFGYIKANWSVAGFKDVIGTCWLTTLSNRSSTEYSPCRNNDTAGHHRQGMCQAGLSAAVTKDGKRIFIGAPGSWYWQGQLFTIESNVTLPFVPSKDIRMSANEGVSSSFHQPSLLATKEGPAYDDNNYLGYSVIVGDFLGNGDSGVAVGVPRGSDLHGKVLLLTSELFNHQNITGDQMGAYFGYALAVNDIDGDDRDDIIITAPFYTNPDLAGIQIETGRIYVFYQGSGLTKFEKYHTRDGENNRGHFGLSISSLGDIDLDGYGDFVIGEPYGGRENRGAIYIFHGTKDGVEVKYSQAIYSEDLEQPLRTFGWSISGGLDLDDNNYPDVVVGAQESDTVIYFRSRPVITMYSEINFLSQSVNLNNKACVLSDGTTAACSELKVCCMYTGLGTWIQQDFTIYVSLDARRKKNPRVFFLDSENTNIFNWTISIKKDQLYCRQMKVYVTPHLKDKLTPMDAEMYIELPKEENRSLNSWKKRDPKRRLKAILGPKNTRKRDSFIIQKNCGPDNICIPELSLNVKTNVEKYLLGSGKILELDVSIENNAEDAFEAVFYLKLPVGIDYINSESQSDSSEIIIQCSAPKLSNENNLRCDVGNPLPYGQIIKFKIYLQPITFHGMKPSYELNMKINSTNPEKPDTSWNNVFNVSLPVWIETDLQIEGESKPQEIDFNSVDYANIEPAILANTLEYGPIITHNYTIRNNGPSTVLNISTSLIWAAETRNTGDILLYLIEQPETSDKKVRCDSANADYLSFKDGQKIRKAIKNKSESNLFRRSIFERPLLDVKEINTKALGISSSKDFEPDFELNSNRYSSMLEVNTQDVDIFERKDHFKREIIKRENQNDLNKIHYLPEQSDEKYDIPLIFNNELLCENAHCVNLQCHVGPLQKDEEVSIAVRYRINVESLKANTKSEKIEVPTKLFAYVTSQPFIGEPTERILRSCEIKTLIQPLANIVSADFIPLWIVVLSACIGTTILLLLVYLLYKCGFFKRNRPLSVPERQPLNKSGSY